MIGFVYVISGGRRLKKLGISMVPERRLRQLQLVHGDGLRIVWTTTHPPAACAVIETVVFRLLKDARVTGEWFNVTSREAVAAVRRAIKMVYSGDYSELPCAVPENAKRLSRWVLRSCRVGGRQSVYSDETKAAVMESLKAGLTVKAVAHLHGVSEPVVYKWRKKHG